MAREQDILQDAIERFDEASSGSIQMREHHRNDTRFCSLSDQWPEWAKQQRIAENRPYWTINRIKPMVTQVVNDIRQNRPGLNVAPADSGADPKTAEVFREIVRSITRTPAAELAGDTAAECAITGGFGFMRIGIDYANDMTFDMAAYIERVIDPLKVYWDVATTQVDSSDWRYAFLAEEIPRKEFERRYPKHAAVDWSGADTSLTHMLTDWSGGERVRIADYYDRESQEYEIVELSNGSVVRRDEMAGKAKGFITDMGFDPDGWSDDEMIAFSMQSLDLAEVRSRKVMGSKIVHRVISGEAVLSTEDWPGKHIPIVPVWGSETVVDGIRDVRGMVRDGRDPQMLLNYWRTSATERVALAGKAPYIVEDGSIPAAHLAAWQTANTRNHPYLVYSEGSNKPQREPPPTIPSGDLQLAMNAAEDLQSITGIYPSALGARSNETSGRAILARQRESDTGSFHFVDNLSRAYKAVGEILIDIIPHIYSEQQTIRIMGEDKQQKVYNLTRKPGTGTVFPAKEGEGEPLYDISVGTYDVYTEIGPNFASAREADREMVLEMASKFPPMMEYGFDLMVDTVDLSNGDKWKERYARAMEARGISLDGQKPPQGGMPVGAQPMQQPMAVDAQIQGMPPQ